MRRRRSRWPEPTTPRMSSGRPTADRSRSKKRVDCIASTSTVAPRACSVTCPATCFVEAPGARAASSSSPRRVACCACQTRAACLSPVTTLDAGAKESPHIGPGFSRTAGICSFWPLPADKRWASSGRPRLTIRHGPGSSRAAGGPRTPLGGCCRPHPRRAVWWPSRSIPIELALRGTPQPVRDRLTGTNNWRRLRVRRLVERCARGGSPSGDRASTRLGGSQPDERWATVGPSATVNSFALAPDERRVVAEMLDSDSLKRDLWLFERERDQTAHG